jgi:aminopeptidase N
LAVGLLLRHIAGADGGTLDQTLPIHIDAMARVLADADSDRRLVVQALTLPGHIYLAEQMPVIDPDAIHAARESMRHGLAQALSEPLWRTYRDNRPDGPYRNDADSIGRRALANTCLGYLCSLDDGEAHAAARAQFDSADNMTDMLGAMAAIVINATADRDQVLASFYQRWQQDPLVVDKWLAMQAMAPRADALDQVRRLMQHSAFSIKNPNKVRALIGAFCAGNPVAFHRADGPGYAFLAEQVLTLDKLNPQVASRMVTPFSQWRRYDAGRQGLMQGQLETILAADGLSPDVQELAGKSLGRDS